MQITCPYCGFSKQVAAERIPPDMTRVTCPKCRQGFELPGQPRPTFEQQQEELQRQQQIRTPLYQQLATAALPKAGFWMRVAAALIDGGIVLTLQLLLGFLLTAAGFMSGGIGGEPGSLAFIIQLFGSVLSFVYYIVFTGHCGQTPGKMVLRIKVIRCDGADISYTRAAFREVPAKFISGIIFGIGYLMVAFDEQKQGLHDRMADTYVIKL